jgi:hypothetical protein
MSRGGVIALVALALVSVACGRSSSSDAGVVTLDDGAVVPPSEWQDPLTLLGRAPTAGFIEIVDVRARDDGTVFACTGVQGLVVVGADDPTSMTEIDQLISIEVNGTYPRCQHVAFSGDRLYFAHRGDEITPESFISVWDTSDEPREVQVFKNTGRSFEGLDASGDMLYAAMHADGLAVLQLLGDTLIERGIATGLTNAWGVRVVGTMVYVADGIGGLAVVDASNPTAPNVVGSIDVGGAAQSVEVDANAQIAWVSAGSGGLVAVDVSTPSEPAIVGRYDSPGSAQQVSLSDGVAYLADWNDVRAIDVSDPAAPSLIAVERIDTSGPFSRVLAVAARGDTVFAGEWTGLFAYQLHRDRTAPDLWIHSRMVEFGEISPGDADATVVVVENQGNEPLTVWIVDTDEPAFSTDTSSLELSPGEREAIEVTFRPTGDQLFEGALRLWSDDPDEQLREVELVGNQAGFGVGDQAPEIFASLLTGGDWRLSEQLGKVVVLSYFATF